MITNLSVTNSLVSEWVSDMRNVDVQTDRARFRRNLERIGEVTAYEISKLLKYKQIKVQTPMAETTCSVLETQPVITTILRAGLPLYQGMMNFFDKADCGFIGAYRKHNTEEAFSIEQEYITSPALAGRPLIIADPMLATGASLILAIQALLEFDQPSEIHIVTAIACTVGIEAVAAKFPQAHIWAAVIDPELTSKGYIVPGLGDAGDLSFGKKRQA